MLTALWLRCVVVVFVVLTLTGCQTTRAKAPLPAPAVDSKAIAASHEAKDTTVIEEAAKIDAIAPQAKAHTDAQRAAVASAPAAELKPAFAILESRIAEQAKTIARQAEQIAALQDAELRAQVRTMRWFGFGCILAAAALGYARQIQFAVIAAGLGVLSLGAAQLWATVASHPLFKPVLGGSIALGLAGLAWAAIHAYKKGDLAKKTEREAERLKDTLKVVVPVLDDAKAQLGDAFAPVLAKLSSQMDWEEKQLVKRIRAES